MADGATIWNKVMTAAMRLPGVKVDRDAFLAAELKPYCSIEQLAQAGFNPVGLVAKSRIDAIADACIRNHTITVTATSMAAGLPGGLAMAATIPGDTAQYCWHTLVLAQKLAYLYGIPDLRDESGHLTEASRQMLTLFVGVMMGAAVADSAVKKISQSLATQVAEHLSQKALPQTFYYPIVKRVARWIGINITEKSFGRTVSKAIPLVGGMVSGRLTYVAFGRAAKRLQAKLQEQMYQLEPAHSDSAPCK